jgi:hypothetical protein
VQDSARDDKGVSRSDSVNNLEGNNIVNDNLDSLLHNIDPEFREFTMYISSNMTLVILMLIPHRLGAQFVEEKALRLGSTRHKLAAQFIEKKASSLSPAAPDSSLLPRGAENEGGGGTATVTLTSDLGSNSFLSKISKLQDTSDQGSFSIEMTAQSSTDDSADMLRFEMATTRRELKELKASLIDVVRQQRTLLATSQSQEQPLVQRLFVSLFDTVKALFQAGAAKSSARNIFSQVFGPGWGAQQSTSGESADDAAAAALVNNFLRTALLLAGCFISPSHMIHQAMLSVREDPVFAILLPCLGFSLAGLMRNIPRHVSWLSGDTTTLEDALGISVKVPLPFCRNFQIFHAFLETHFENKPGLSIVRAKHYNLMLGDRKGAIILQGSEGWKSGTITARSKIVMAIYIASETSLCLNCGKALTKQSAEVYSW